MFLNAIALGLVIVLRMKAIMIAFLFGDVLIGWNEAIFHDRDKGDQDAE